MKSAARMESSARAYSRIFPVTFQSGSGSFLFDVTGKQYIDFLCSAGALCYGHNDPRMKLAVIDYLQGNGVISSLDLVTCARSRFLEQLDAVILAPRRLDYRVQFTGPTGANAVECALKIARKVTGRSNILAFTNSYHGLSAGALAVTADNYYRHESFIARTNVSFLPFDGYFGPEVDTLPYIERLLADPSSGVDPAAAVILETVQAEGGVNVARIEWLRGMEALCRRFGMLLIVDDIQAGCGRTGTFFSFESAGIHPDIVILSKGISGFGLPMSLVLLNPVVDQWEPGEHNGTFRGNNLAFVAAIEALKYWQEESFAASIQAKGVWLKNRLGMIAKRFAESGVCVRGRGMIWGLDLEEGAMAAAAVQASFARGLILENCGPKRSVLKLLPPFCCSEEVLLEAADIIELALEESIAASRCQACA